MKSLILFAAVVAVAVAQSEQLPALRVNPRFLSSVTTARPRLVTVPARVTIRPKPPVPTQQQGPVRAPPALPRPLPPRPAQPSPPPTTARPPQPTLASQPLPTRPVFVVTTPAPPAPTTLAPPAPTQFIRITSPPREFFPAPSEVPTVIISRPPPPSRPLSTAAPNPNLSYRSNTDDVNAQVLSYENEINPDGTYQYQYAIDNGIAAAAQGRLVDVYGDRDLLSQAVQGSFQWGYPNGEKVLITYVADENGYQPQGDALPTPPPIPPLIARALEWTARRLAERNIEIVQPLTLSG